MPQKPHACPECESGDALQSRRRFLRTIGLGAAAATAGSLLPFSRAGEASAGRAPETVVKRLYDSLSEKQKKAVSFDWDHVDPKRGLLRTYLSANWRITQPAIRSEFYTAEQQRMIRDVFEGIIHPDWHARLDKQLDDDDDGFGTNQAIAIFGTPGSVKFELVLTGRHMTLRCDGDSAEHVAFGGPILYGHAASGLREKPDHPGNVFWHQAMAANGVYGTLDGKQQKQALVKTAPRENAVGFQGSGGRFSGIPVAELSADQKEHVQKVLRKLIEPYRQSDRDEVVACLKTQGGLDRCHLAFYQQGDLGDDGVWDVWRLEGPAFVWHFRGSPHVHTWVHVADDPSVKLNT
ncbi:MAG: DUF3500 domain-containing protein [Planctomycetota bacterium]|jgi:hypothetical protein